MNDMITVRGVVATDITLRATQNGDSQASFRCVTTDRVFDRATGSYADGHSNWFTVSAYRHLAQNAAFSVHKGDPILVSGRLKVRQWTNSEGRSGTNVDIEADLLGHDLRWGIAQFKRATGRRREGEAQPSGVPIFADGSEVGDAAGEGEAALESGLTALASHDEAPVGVDPATGEILDGQQAEEDSKRAEEGEELEGDEESEESEKIAAAY